MAAAKTNDTKPDADETKATSTDKPTSRKKTYIVTAALVATKDPDGRLLYLYRGAQLPATTTQAEIDRLAEMDLIGEDDGTVMAGIAVEPTA